MNCVGRGGRGGRAAGPTPSHEIIGQLNSASVGSLTCQTGLGNGMPMPTMDCSPGRTGANGGECRQPRQSGAAMPRASVATHGCGNFSDSLGNGNCPDDPVDPQYMEGCRRIVDCMNRLWQEQKLCDVIIQAQSDQVKAHKLALVAYSDVLLEKFCKFPPGSIRRRGV